VAALRGVFYLQGHYFIHPEKDGRQSFLQETTWRKKWKDKIKDWALKRKRKNEKYYAVFGNQETLFLIPLSLAQSLILSFLLSFSFPLFWFHYLFRASIFHSIPFKNRPGEINTQ